MFFFLVNLAADKNSATVTAAVPDTRAQCIVNGEAPGTPITLNLSITKVNIDVTSPDGTGKAVRFLSSMYNQSMIPRTNIEYPFLLVLFNTAYFITSF